MAHVTLFSKTHFGGRSLQLEAPSATRYALVPVETLTRANFNKGTSSLKLRSNTPDIPSMCLLFDEPRFRGGFRSFHYHVNRPVESLGSFDNKTESVLLVDHTTSKNNIVFSLRENIDLDVVNALVDEQISGIDGATRRGNVRLTFKVDLWEYGLNGLDMVEVYAPLLLYAGWPWGSYKVNLHFYVNLFINKRFEVRAEVLRYSYWIEAGAVSGSIAGQLKPQVKGRLRTIQKEFNRLLAANTDLKLADWSDVYLMPGRLESVKQDYDGNLHDDVTGILVMR